MRRIQPTLAEDYASLLPCCLSVLNDANAHQNTRLYAVTANMEGKTKAVSALMHGGRVDIPSGRPAANADGSLKVPPKNKRKTVATAAPGKKKAVTTSPDGKTVSMSKGHWTGKLQLVTTMKREKLECDAKILTLKEDVL